MIGKFWTGFKTVRLSKSAGLAAVAGICILLGSRATMGQLLDAAPAPAMKKPSKLSPANRQEAQKLFNGLPLLFEKNQGQSASGADFLSRSADQTLFLKANEAVMVHTSDVDRSRSSVTMQWLGANAKSVAEGEGEIGAKSNYFMGSDPSHWTTKVANFTGVRYKALYPGVDLVYYGNQRHLEYDLNVAAGTDPAAIRFRVDGASRSHIDKQTGDLVMQDGGNNEVRFQKPLVYQSDGDVRKPVAASFRLDADNTVSFALGDYDHKRTLVIDPYVVYSTVFGGDDINAHTPNDLNGENTLLGMVVDSSGDVYLQGITSADDMPTSATAYQTACNLSSSTAYCWNFFVAKFDPTKSGAASLLYSTYLGVTADQYLSDEDIGVSSALAVDSSGNAYLVGSSQTGTGSFGYPTTANAYSASCGMGGSTTCYGGVFSKLDSTGSNLLYSTYLPLAEVSGSYGVAAPVMVGVDSHQIAYVAGVAGPGLFTTDGSSCSPCAGYGGAIAGTEAAFVAAFDTTKSNAASLVYAEYLPIYSQLSQGPGPIAFAVDPNGGAYITGDYPSGITGLTTQTINFNGFQTTAAGTYAVSYNNETTIVNPVFFRLSNTGVVTYATYVGNGTGSSSTFYGNYTYLQTLYGVSADANGIAYVGGMVSPPVLTTNGYYTGDVLGAYVAKIDTNQTGTASMLYGTYVFNNDVPANRTRIWAVADNGAGLLGFSGQTTYGPTPDPEVNPVTQPDNISASTNLSFAGIIDTTKTGISSLQFLSYLDGVSSPYYVAFDPSSNLYVGGEVSLPSSAGDNYENGPFLSLPSSYAVSEGQPNVGNIHELYTEPFFYKISFAPSTITVSPGSLPFGNQIQNIASASQPVTVQNTSTITPITFNSITLPLPFTETDNCQPSLAASSSCTINVIYTPTTLTASNGTMTLWDSDVSTVQTVSLSGTGIAGTPGATLTSAVNFGNVQTGTTTTAMPVTLKNSGTAPLTGITVTLGGTNPSNFTMTNGCTSTLAIGANCTINVTFSPNASNSFSATISVADNATPSPQVSNLSGTGVSYTATLTPTFINFGTIAIGTTATAIPVTLTNTGTSVLNITSIGLLYNTANIFTISSNGCGGTLGVGLNCVINVTAKPQASGNASAYLNVVDNSTTSPHNTLVEVTGPYPIALSGIGTPSYAAYATNLSTSSNPISTSASGGVPPYTFTFSFPVGSGNWSQTVTGGGSYLYIDGAPAYATLSGIPFSITVTDSLGATTTQGSTLYVNQLYPATTVNATPTVLPGGTNLSFYVSEVVPATSITPAFPSGSVTYQVDSGAPTNLALTTGSTAGQALSFDILYHQIAVNYSGDSNYVGTGTTYAVNGNRAQTITFNGGINAPNGSTLALTAHASSGLPVTYSVISGPGTIDGSGTNLIISGTGPITVQASQSGDPSFAAAPNVTATFTGY